MFTEGGDPREIVEARGLIQVTDIGAIEQAVDCRHRRQSRTRRSRRRRSRTLLGWFVGQVMKAMGGKASPQAVNDLVKAKLGIE